MADAHSSSKKRRVEDVEIALKELLCKKFARIKDDGVTLLERLQFEESIGYSRAAKLLRDDGFEDCTNCEMTGLQTKKIPQETATELGDALFGLEIRNSRLYMERPCYPRLFDFLMGRWMKKNKTKAIVTGNSGIGKSWFQVYFLQQLLVDRSNSGKKKYLPSIRFILRQSKGSFFLLDLESCKAWKMTLSRARSENCSIEAESFMTCFRGIFYLFDPGSDQNLAPLFQAGTPALSTLSPNPNRVKGYKKEARPITLYMPIWERTDLEFVFTLEKGSSSDDRYNFDTQYSIFGGIVRRTLDYDPSSWKDEESTLQKRINTVDIKIIRSLHFGLDDSSDGQAQNNISGYICSYVDIEETGEDAFSEPNLAMSSDYVRQKVQQKLGLTKPIEHGKRLLECVNKEARDISGIDLEVSAVYLLSLGPSRVKWDYEEVGKIKSQVLELKHKKMEINRIGGDFDAAKLHYPKDRSFALVDFFCTIEGIKWGFQTTWQSTHPFKLRTLWSLRKTLGIHETQQLNILYVLADEKKMESYLLRPKIQYLAKGESLHHPIMDGKKVLSESQVQCMWDKTAIYVCYPREKNWRKALHKWIESSP